MGYSNDDGTSDNGGLYGAYNPFDYTDESSIESHNPFAKGNIFGRGGIVDSFFRNIDATVSNIIGMRDGLKISHILKPSSVNHAQAVEMFNELLFPANPSPDEHVDYLSLQGNEGQVGLVAEDPDSDID